jgi:hypothetical protein
LEDIYTCDTLSKRVCEEYSAVDGLFVSDAPCFYNGRFTDEEEDANNCSSVSSLLTSTCENIKTNERVSVEGEMRFCDNAQSLFKIKGKYELGCSWEEDSGCVDAVNGEMAAVCDDYKDTPSCNYHFSLEGECFWNIRGESGGCFSMKSIQECTTICTNDVSGINSHYCSGNGGSFEQITSEICRWGDEEGEYGSCKCEGLEIPSKCDEYSIKSIGDCKLLYSEKGLCFFNGGNKITSEEEIKCSDIVEVKKCIHLLSRSLCVYARRYTYPNLEPKISAENTSFLCYWDGETESGCVSKFEPDETNDSFPAGAVVAIIIVVLVVVAACIIVVIIVIWKMKMKALKKEGELEGGFIMLSNTVQEDGVPLEDQKRKHVTFYTVGEVIGKYKIQKLLGRGW